MTHGKTWTHKNFFLRNRKEDIKENLDLRKTWIYRKILTHKNWIRIKDRGTDRLKILGKGFQDWRFWIKDIGLRIKNFVLIMKDFELRFGDWGFWIVDFRLVIFIIDFSLNILTPRTWKYRIYLTFWSCLNSLTLTFPAGAIFGPFQSTSMPLISIFRVSFRYVHLSVI